MINCSAFKLEITSPASTFVDFAGQLLIWSGGYDIYALNRVSWFTKCGCRSPATSRIQAYAS